MELDSAQFCTFVSFKIIENDSCQYAIKSCIYLAVKQDKIDVTKISEFINSPVSFTSKILQKQKKSNI